MNFGKYLGDPIRKRAGFLSNGIEIMRALQLRCSGKTGQCSRRRGGRHAIASGRAARDAARYPPELVSAIIRGIKSQLRDAGYFKQGEVGLHALDDDRAAEASLKSVAMGYSGKFRDDITGQPLRNDLVMEARATELRYFNEKGVWRKKTRQ